MSTVGSLRAVLTPSVEDFGLHGPEAFDYLCKGNTLTVDGMDDLQEYNDMRVRLFQMCTIRKLIPVLI